MLCSLYWIEMFRKPLGDVPVLKIGGSEVCSNCLYGSCPHLCSVGAHTQVQFGRVGVSPIELGYVEDEVIRCLQMVAAANV